MSPLSTEIQLIDSMTKPLQHMTNALNMMISELEAADRAGQTAFNKTNFSGARSELAQMQIGIDSVVGGMQQEEKAQEHVNSEIRRGTGEAGQFNNAIKTVAATYFSMQTAKKVFDLSDELSNTKARLETIGLSLDDVYSSARRSRGELLQTADVIAKMGTQAKRAFANTDELVAFSETLSKTFVVGGNNSQAIESVVYNLTQAMGTGILRGQDLNAVMSNTPQIAQAIADYLETDIGQIRKLAEQGKLTADVVKNAMLSATDEINIAFEAMPWTFSQAMTEIKNDLIMSVDPLLAMLAEGAGWIHENWANIEPVFWGIVAAVTAYVAVSQISALWTALNTTGTVAHSVALIAQSIVMALVALATGNMALMQQALNTAMLASPIGWIMIAIVVLIAVIYRWVKSIGGVKVAWLTALDAIKSGWDKFRIGFMTGVYNILNALDNMGLGYKLFAMNANNAMGDAKVWVLTKLQSMVNESIDIINAFIGVLNEIPGVNLSVVAHATFATTADLKNEAQKQARAGEYEKAEQSTNAAIKERDAALRNMRVEAARAQNDRWLGIQEAKKAGTKEEDKPAFGESDPSLGNSMERTAGNTARTADALATTNENLKYMRDLAEQQVINRFTTAEIKVEMGGITQNVSKDTDATEFISMLTERLEESLEIVSEGVY